MNPALAQRIRAARSSLDVLRGGRDAATVRLSRASAEVSRLEGEEEVADLAGGVLRTLIDDEVTQVYEIVDGMRTVMVVRNDMKNKDEVTLGFRDATTLHDLYGTLGLTADRCIKCHNS